MKSSPNSGFSLVEVLAAMVIMSVALVALLASQAQSVGLVDRAKKYDRATTLASAKLSELTMIASSQGTSAMKEEERGEFDQELHPGFRWRYEIRKVPAPNFAALLSAATGEEEETQDQGNAALFAGPLQTIQDAWGESLRELRVEVLWGEQTEKSVELVTHIIEGDPVTRVDGIVRGLGGGQ